MQWCWGLQKSVASIRSKFEAALWHMAGVDHPGGFIGNIKNKTTNKNKKNAGESRGQVTCGGLACAHLCIFLRCLCWITTFWPSNLCSTKAAGLGPIRFLLCFFSRGGFTRFYPRICCFFSGWVYPVLPLYLLAGRISHPKFFLVQRELQGPGQFIRQRAWR